MTSKIALSCCMLAAVAMPCSMDARSLKRGIGWDEKTQALSNNPVDLMLPGISWIYNWGETPIGTADHLGTPGGLTFIPMAWGRDFNEAAIRKYLTDHKDVKYLLGFNEPNFSAQSNMTPAEAATLWPKLEKIADDFNLKLVAPALNFTGESVGGRVWGIYDWLDEFIREYKSKNNRLPKMDCLALHCYMNWYSATTWFATQYMYSDIFKDGNDTKYPNLVEVLNGVKAATGQFPRMMLTEFCSWEGDKDGFVTNVDTQIDQMTQRIQKLELSDLVEGYAWFMANSEAAQYPYMSVFQTNDANSDLSTLGKVYVHMSSFDRDKYYKPGETIPAVEYVDATTDEQMVRLRPNTEAGSPLPLLAILTAGVPESSRYSSASYLIDVPRRGTYTFTLHARTTGAKVGISTSNTAGETELLLVGHPASWADYSVDITLPPGKSTVRITNLSPDPVSINSWRFGKDSGIDEIAPETTDSTYTVYTLQGIPVGTNETLSTLKPSAGAYLIVGADGKSQKVLISPGV